MAMNVVGQYECEHTSGLGFDYFTSRVDTLTIYADGRFELVVQNKSRISSSANKLKFDSQADTTRMGGTYSVQGLQLALTFSNGGFEPGQLAPDGSGVTLGPNFFKKVSDNTFLPNTERLQKNMTDMQKGLEIAGKIGGFAMKAVKGLNEMIKTDEPQANQQQKPTPQQQPPVPASAAPKPAQASSFCEYCGTPLRPGRKFCGNCGKPVNP